MGFEGGVLCFFSRGYCTCCSALSPSRLNHPPVRESPLVEVGFQLHAHWAGRGGMKVCVKRIAHAPHTPSPSPRLGLLCSPLGPARILGTGWPASPLLGFNHRIIDARGPG